MKPETWPFRPRHITNDGDTLSDRPELRSLTGPGIIPNSYLQGLVTVACANVGKPCTMFEFTPDGRSAVRTDARSPIYQLSKPCVVFRELTNRPLCQECNAAHALLYQGLSKDGLVPKLTAAIGSSETLKSYYDAPREAITIDNSVERPCIQYACPLLGYGEICSPVFFEGQVIGAFFTGELCLVEGLDQIARTRAEFFRQLRSSDPRLDWNDIERRVTAAHDEWIHDPNNLFHGDGHARLLSEVDDELRYIENVLSEQMDQRRMNYVVGRVDRRIAELRQELPNEVGDAQESLKAFWRNVGKRLQDMITDLAMRYVVVFGTKQLGRDAPARLDVVVAHGDLPANIDDAEDALSYDLDRLPAELRRHPVTSVDDRRLFDGLQGFPVKIDCSHMLIRVFPVPFLAEGNVAVLLGFHDWNSLKSPENQKDWHLDRSLQSFYTVMLSAVSSIIAAAEKNLTEDTVRVFGHEAGQLTSGLDRIRQSYLSSGYAILRLTKGKADDVARDLDCYLGQMRLLFQRAQMLIRFRKPTKDDFWPFRELLFKWKDVYRMEAEVRSLQICVCPPASGDPLRSQMYADRGQMEQLVYNLVDNAVKYCHRGTRVEMDCCRGENKPGSPHVLTVTSYGQEMEEGDEPYELYYRGRNAGEEGLGIGLYIARQVAKGHGGSISHDVAKLSDFNVPLVASYLAADSPLRNTDLISGLQKDLRSLQGSGTYERVVARDARGQLSYAMPSEQELLRSIEKPTYRVTFRVTIPAKETTQ